jgi:hypothetical protein
VAAGAAGTLTLNTGLTIGLTIGLSIVLTTGGTGASRSVREGAADRCEPDPGFWHNAGTRAPDSIVPERDRSASLGHGRRVVDRSSINIGFAAADILDTALV